MSIQCMTICQLTMMMKAKTSSEHKSNDDDNEEKWREKNKCERERERSIGIILVKWLLIWIVVLFQLHLIHLSEDMEFMEIHEHYGRCFAEL